MSTTAPRLLTLAEFLDRPRPCWLVDGLLPAGEMAVLFGAYASGKSFAALEIAGCVTQGRDFAGRSVRRGRVLYLIAEGCDGMRDRFDVLEREGRVERANLVVGDSGCQIGDADNRRALEAKLVSMNFKPDLIIVDTLARHAVGVEENSAKDMGEWIASVEKLARHFGCSVLLIHHIGKLERNGMRGSSALPGAVSTSIDCGKQGNWITLKCHKQKDADEFEPLNFRTRKVKHDGIESLVLDHCDGGAATKDQLKADEVAVLSALEAAFPLSVMRVEFKRSNGSAIPNSTFDRTIKHLIELGRAERMGHGEYVFAKSPSPNNPQESPMGIKCAPHKSPPSPPPYRGGDVGIGAAVQKAKAIGPWVLPATAMGGELVEIKVPKFAELETWSVPEGRSKEWLN